MDKVQKMKQEKQYEQYVKQKTPQHNVWLNMLKAFITGGSICVIGQVFYHYCELQNLSKDDCSGWTSMLLVLLSVILTGVGIYPQFAKWGGAGALVPITGFANSVALPPSNIKKKDRSSASDVRSSPLPALSFCMESSQAGDLDYYTGWEH